MRKQFSRVMAIALSMLFLAGCGIRGYDVPENQPLVLSRPDVSRIVETQTDNEELIRIMNQNIKYLLNTWWNAEKPESLMNQYPTEIASFSNEKKSLIRKSQKSFANWQKNNQLYLAINTNRTFTENSIRPLSHVCAIVSTALAGKYYDESVVGISEDDAKAMTIKLITAAADAYKKDRWGRTWQSALWAENIGYAAWLMWDDFPEEDQREISFMVLTEADNVLNMEIPFYRDSEGNELCIGDTKGEEIAWNTKILALAICMFPNHENVTRWETKLIEMLVAATSTPEDVHSTEKIDGISLMEYLGGSNINSDGTVINHGLCHIDYMTTIVEEITETRILFELAGRSQLESSLHNIDLIYNALVNADLGTYDESKQGTFFYQRDDAGNVTTNTDMPGVNDWGGYWYANYYLTDVYVGLFGLDEGIEEKYKACYWRDGHLQVVSNMVNRNEEGNFFLPEENIFTSGEMFQMNNLVRAYMLEKLFSE